MITKAPKNLRKTSAINTLVKITTAMRYGFGLEIITATFKSIHGQFDIITTENLYTFDGERSFSLGQGE